MHNILNTNPKTKADRFLKPVSFNSQKHIKRFSKIGIWNFKIWNLTHLIHFLNFQNSLKPKKPLRKKRFLYPEPESNRHGFPQVFETSASTNSAIRA
jgi:hypothetical protein